MGWGGLSNMPYVKMSKYLKCQKICEMSKSQIDGQWTKFVKIALYQAEVG